MRLRKVSQFPSRVSSLSVFQITLTWGGQASIFMVETLRYQEPLNGGYSDPTRTNNFNAKFDRTIHILLSTGFYREPLKKRIDKMLLRRHGCSTGNISNSFILDLEQGTGVWFELIYVHGGILNTLLYSDSERKITFFFSNDKHGM